MEVRIVNKSGFALPAYETQHSAGVDLRAAISERITLAPGQRELIPTGLFIALPDGTEAQIRPRSGLAFKKGITVLNSPGTIDADYRGEIKVLLINLGQEYCDIEPGDRIAQMVFARYYFPEFIPSGEKNCAKRLQRFYRAPEQSSRVQAMFGSTSSLHDLYDTEQISFLPDPGDSPTRCLQPQRSACHCRTGKSHCH